MEEFLLPNNYKSCKMVKIKTQLDNGDVDNNVEKDHLFRKIIICLI